MSGLKPEDRLIRLTLRDVLAEFSPDEIEAYLKKMSRKISRSKKFLIFPFPKGEGVFEMV